MESNFQKWYKWTFSQNRIRLRDIEIKPKGKYGGGRDKSGTWDEYTHTTYIRYIINKALLYNTGNATQYFVITYMRREPKKEWIYVSDQIRSVAQSCPTLCYPMNCSTPGLPVHHQLLEFTQTHVHRVSDAIQPSHPLSSPSPPDPNPSQHQSLFHSITEYLCYTLETNTALYINNRPIIF